MARPNLLFLFTDEQRADTMAAYGNRRIETPNLNRLAGQSTVFDRACVTQPVCTPSRSSIVTGLWPHTNGCTANNIPLGDETPCLPEMLGGGYATGYHGKWHLGDEIFAQHGFDDWVSIEDMYFRWYRDGRDRDARSSYHHFLVEHGYEPDERNRFRRQTTANLPEAVSRPAFLAREASRFIRERRRDPFCLFVNFLEPHMPFTGPRNDQHPPADVTVPADFDCPPTADQPLKARLLSRYYADHGFGGLPLRTEADWRRLIARYRGLCSLVDTHVGTILRTLEDCGLDDNTIVVYTSDHGDMMGSHRLLAKCVMFDEAIRVPLLVRLPGQTARVPGSAPGGAQKAVRRGSAAGPADKLGGYGQQEDSGTDCDTRRQVPSEGGAVCLRGAELHD
jgi:arylsulfatase A-like enzyme